MSDELLDLAKHLREHIGKMERRGGDYIQYFVVDPIGNPSMIYSFVDEQGKRFAQVHPNLLEKIPRGKYSTVGALIGVPVYERENLPQGLGVPAIDIDWEKLRRTDET